MKKLYSVFISFSDHLVGIGQYQAETPIEALQEFIKTNESLEGYDRSFLMQCIHPESLIHTAEIKGIWGILFSNVDLRLSTKWPNDNAVLGGHIVQTDPDAPIRK
jgi:hypothetical protein